MSTEIAFKRKDDDDDADSLAVDLGNKAWRDFTGQ